MTPYRCTRCNRRLKAPSESGMGDKCRMYVLGTKPRRVQILDRRPVKRDDRTPDLFEAAPPALVSE